MKRLLGILVFVGAALASAAPSLAEEVLLPLRFSSGAFDGQEKELAPVHAGVVYIPGAAAFRVVFDDWRLGERTIVTLRSYEDDAVQYLSAADMQRWRDGSAYFNGDAVEVGLLLAPEDRGVSVSVAGALIERAGAEPRQICGSADNRAASNDPAVARLGGGNPDGCSGGGGCSAWLFSNGAMIAAGHCGPSHNTLVQFNVPLSDADGTLNFPPPEDQYRVDGTTVVNEDSGSLNDWSMFNVLPNTNTGLMPVIAQAAFYRGTVEAQTPTNVRVTGFGYDDSPPFSCNWVSTHKSQQTHAGPYVSYVDNGDTERSHRFRTDLRSANSGSPAIIDGSTLTLGVVTNAACTGEDPEEGSNTAVSFRNTAFRAAVENYLGAGAIYADAGHPSNLETGTVFQPYSTVVEAFDAAPNNGVVYIVRGNYTTAAGNAVLYTGKNVLFRAPSGTVVIGN